jgi:hypothetical protein
MVSGGSSESVSFNELMRDLMPALSRGIPGLSQLISSQILPNALRQLEAREATAPREAALNLQLVRDFGQQFAGADLSRNLALLQSPEGQALISAELAARRQADPEYYATRELTANRLGDLLNSIDIEKLSGGERAEVERASNQRAASSGDLNVPSTIGTVENAMMFGDRLTQKKKLLSDAINTASGFLPTAKAGEFSGIETTGGQNFGANSFTTGGNTAQDALNLGQNIFGGLTGVAGSTVQPETNEFGFGLGNV